jgi:GLPGLI family protein
MKRLNKILLLGLFFLATASTVQGQMIRAGKIVFERKTNLHKKYPDPEMRRWIGNEKYKYDNFILYFNDTMSIFDVDEGPSAGRGDWATIKNKHVTFLNQKMRHSILNVMGEEIVVVDSVKQRAYKRLGRTREIAGYRCQMVRYHHDDSTRFYVWYTDAIIPSVGPETYLGLPGAILGLATEDGGVVYFAKSVQAMIPEMKALMPKYRIKKAQNEEQVKEFILQKTSGTPWAKMILRELFLW